MRILIITLAVLVALVVGGYFKIVAPQKAHRRAYERVAAVIDRSEKSPPPGLDANTWHNYVLAPSYLLANFFLRREYYPTAKLEAMGGQFEARWPDGPRTPQDIVDMIDFMTAANPPAADLGYARGIRAEIVERESAPKVPDKK